MFAKRVLFGAKAVGRIVAVIVERLFDVRSPQRCTPVAVNERDLWTNFMGLGLVRQ